MTDKMKSRAREGLLREAQQHLSRMPPSAIKPEKTAQTAVDPLSTSFLGEVVRAGPMSCPAILCVVGFVSSDDFQPLPPYPLPFSRSHVPETLGIFDLALIYFPERSISHHLDENSEDLVLSCLLCPESWSYRKHCFFRVHILKSSSDIGISFSSFLFLLSYFP
jgi:hypothetical protein